MAHRCVRRDAAFRTRLDNNGQTSIVARDGYDVNDPKQTIGISRADQIDAKLSLERKHEPA